ESSPAPARTGDRPLLRRAAVQPDDDLVDRGTAAPRSGNPDPPRGLSATLYSRWCRTQSSPGARRRTRSPMSVPLSQMMTVTSYVMRQKLRGVKRYPLVLMLEPLFRCNLACAGCGKIQYPAQVLRKHLTVERCLEAVEECGAPMVSIPGGEPLMYPDIDRLVAELVKRRKYVYLCTNAILLHEKLSL